MKTFRWTSEAGRAAVARLDAYGELRRYELAGEVAALTTASGGGGRGKPGDVPGLSLWAWDVEITLREWDARPGSRVVRLLDHVWATGRSEIVTEHRFVLTDGERLVLSPEELRMQGEPGRYMAREDVTEKVFTYSWDDFEDEGIDRAAPAFSAGEGGDEWFEARADLLELLHDRFVRFMVSRRGLDAAAEAKPPKAIPFPAVAQPYGVASDEERGYAA